MAKSGSKVDERTLRTFVVEAAQLLHDRHCEDVAILDLRGLSNVCDYLLIGSGTSDRQMKSVAGELEKLGDERSFACFRSDRDTGLTWIVVDFIELVVHLFEPGQRAYYDLEGMWSDASRVEWARESDRVKKSS